MGLANMNVTGYLSLILAVIVRSATLSALTDGNMQNSTIQDLAGIDVKNVDVFRQLLNQETIIRMTLVKNVHALMKDMLTLKENLAVTEQKLSTLQTSTDRQISELKTKVQSLERENNLLKTENTAHKKHLAGIERNITNISKNHEKFQRNIDIDRKAFERNFSDTLADIKIEVRYLSITLLDLNAHTRQIENNIPDIIDQKILAISESINSSLENFNATLINRDDAFLTQLSDLENSHTTVLSTVTGNYHTFISNFSSSITYV
jgi:regulator of replication initiation timing